MRKDDYIATITDPNDIRWSALMNKKHGFVLFKEIILPFKGGGFRSDNDSWVKFSALPGRLQKMLHPLQFVRAVRAFKNFHLQKKDFEDYAKGDASKEDKNMREYPTNVFAKILKESFSQPIKTEEDVLEFIELAHNEAVEIYGSTEVAGCFSSIVMDLIEYEVDQLIKETNLSKLTLLKKHGHEIIDRITIAISNTYLAINEMSFSLIEKKESYSS